MAYAGVTDPSSTQVLPRDSAQEVARFFQILADPTRVRIVKALAEARWSVSDLAQALEMDQPAVSHQLKYLRNLGIVNWEKAGRHVYYSLENTLIEQALCIAIAELDDLEESAP